MREDLANRRSEIKTTIRDAAILEFAEHGLKGASTQAIADRAGITKTKLHYYISSKEDLYLEALNHITQTWEELFQGVSLDKGPEEFLRDYIARKVHYSLERPAEVKLFVNEVMRGGKRLSEPWINSKGAVERAAAQIETWIENGLMRPVHPVLLQFNLWSLTEQYAVMGEEARFMLGLDEDQPLNAELVIDEICGLVLGGLRP